MRARQVAANRLGVVAGPELDPALMAYETTALDLAVASFRDDLVHNFGQSWRVFSLPYFGIDLAGYTAVRAMASAAPVRLSRLAALPHRLALTLDLARSAAEAQVICKCFGCPGVFETSCNCPDAKPTPSPKDPKKPPGGLTPAGCRDIPKHIVSADGTSCKPDGSVPCPRGGISLFTDPFCRTYPIDTSRDPNDKAGSGGSGPERFVPAGTPMPYVSRSRTFRPQRRRRRPWS